MAHRKQAARFLWEARRTEHLKRFVMIGLHTGTRSGAIRNLEWSWLNLDRGTMRRRAPGVGETKNKRTPTIRIPRQLLHFLRRWKRADAGKTKYVVHYDGQPIRRDIYRAWNTAKKRAELPWLHPHVLRHTAATWRAQRGVSPWQAAGFLGMTLKVFESTYGHHSPDFQKDAADIRAQLSVPKLCHSITKCPIYRYKLIALALLFPRPALPAPPTRRCSASFPAIRKRSACRQPSCW